VNAVSFSANGTVLAAGCEDGTVHLWRAATFAEVAAREAQDRTADSRR